MYRGDPPNGKLHDVTDEQYALMATKICRLRLENLHLRILPHTKGKLTLKFLTSANKKARSSFANLQVESLGHSVAQISNFDTRDANGVKVPAGGERGLRLLWVPGSDGGERRGGPHHDRLSQRRRRTFSHKFVQICAVGSGWYTVRIATV